MSRKKNTLSRKTGASLDRKAEYVLSESLHASLKACEKLNETFSNSEIDSHGHFMELCMLYGDFNRPVFLGEIRHWFIRNADKAELTTIRKAVQARTRTLKGGGGRGRPCAQDDENFLSKARVTAWQRIVLGWSWPKILEDAGLEVTKTNKRTAKRRLDYLAAVIWSAVPQSQHIEEPEKLNNDLEAKTIQRLLQSKTGLPFHIHPEECKKIILELAPRGLEAKVRLIRTATKSREK